MFEFLVGSAEDENNAQYWPALFQYLNRYYQFMFLRC